jgi:hypothetical protein
MEVGLHNPALPADERFRSADGFGSRRITHRVTSPEDAAVDEALQARMREAYALAWEDESH